MAHAITQRKNGFNEMAYVGEKPWHGLGQELRDGATIEEWTAAAGMDWRIQRSRVRYAIDGAAQSATFRAWDDYHVLMRSDSKEPLGMVSDRFKVVQPREVLEFFRDLVDVAGFKLETAGTLHGGRKFWALASIGVEDRIVGQDLVEGKIMLATACDGTMNTIAKNVATRVVCANTLAIAMSEKGAAQVNVSHRSHFNAEEVKAQLGLTITSFHRFIKDARALAARVVTQTEANAIIAASLGEAPRELTNDAMKAASDAVVDSRAYKKILALFQGGGRGAQAAGVRGTAWGVVNAVTEYVDHHAQARTDSNRLDSAWFGHGNDAKTAAMEIASRLATMR